MPPLKEMIETFDFLGDWEARHQFLVEMGDKLLPMPPELKSEANRVRGCQSTVHIFARHRPGSAEASTSWPTVTPPSCAA